MRLQPVIFLTLAEHDLQAAEAQGNQTEADVINAIFARGRTALVIHKGRILDHTVGQQKRDETHRHVDEEDPAPGIVICDPATQHGADRRSRHNYNRE